MGALRVVLYAEGGGETSGHARGSRAPGELIEEEALGAGHLLLRRAIASQHSISERALLLEEPLRTRGRIALGSDLQHERTLAQLLTWANPTRQPDLALVLVDCDGEPGRKARLVDAVRERPVVKIVAVAIEEFEAWLIADHKAVLRVLGSNHDFPGPPESLARRAAKTHLQDWTSDAGKDRGEIRRTLARSSDLGVIASSCSAFAELLREIALLGI